MFFQHYSEKIESSCPIYSCSLTYQNSLVVNTYGQTLIPNIPLPSKPDFNLLSVWKLLDPLHFESTSSPKCIRQIHVSFFFFIVYI